MPIPIPESARVRLSDDGAHVLLDGPCAPEGEERYCWLDTDGARTPVNLGGELARNVVDVRGARLLVCTEEQPIRCGAYRPGGPPPRLASAGRAALLSPRLFDDGAWWALFGEGYEELEGIVVAPSGGSSAEVRQWPAGASRAESDGSDWMVAYGRTTDELWTSHDRGRTWQRLRFGFARAQPLDFALSGLGISARCEPGGCHIGRLWIEYDTPRASRETAVLEPPPLELESWPAPLADDAVRLSCRVTEPPSASPFGSVPSVLRTRPILEARELPAFGYRFSVERRGRRGPVRLRWSASPGEPANDVASDWIEASAWTIEGHDVPVCEPRLADDRSLLLRCASRTSSPSDDELEDDFVQPMISWWLVERAGGAHHLEGFGMPEFVAVRRFGDEHVFLDSMRMIAFSRAGARTWQENLWYRDREDDAHLASIGGEVGIFVQPSPVLGLASAHARTIRPLGEWFPVLLPADPQASFNVCSGASDDVRIWRELDISSPEPPRVRGGSELFAELAIGDGRVCIARVERPMNRRSVVDLHIEGGAFVGTIDNHLGERFTVRCVPSAPRASSLDDLD